MRNSLIFLIFITLVSFSNAEQLNFYVNGNQKNDAVKFTSKATLETIEGKTSEIKGYVSVDPSEVTSGAEAKLAVTLESLKTGIDMRDKHMRENHLETEKYPEAVFILNKVTGANGDLADGQSKQLTLEGDFTIHGITRTITLDATVTFTTESENTNTELPGDILHIVTQFEVALADYEIKRPKFLFLKLSEKQTVEIDFFASTGSPEVVFTD
jgi:polyisoprenoid-binding protein YceI